MSARLVSLVVLLALACDPPPVSSGADARQNTYSGRVEGHVVVQSAARGNVVLFLFDATHPPPPAGTGHPVTFTVLPRDAVFGSAAASDTGPFTANYTFSLVAAGNYLVRGFVDVNDDFVPWYRVTNEVHTGDVGGAALTASGTSRVVTVGVDAAGHPLAVTDVPVTFGDVARVPVDRPVFEFNPATVSLGATPSQLTLTARAIDQGGVKQPAPVFLAQLIDANGDGVPDVDANGVPLMWPKVVVRKVADANPLRDENDLNNDGLLEATDGFADYAHLDPSTGATIAADGKPDLVVLAAGFDVSQLLPDLLDSQGKVKATPTALASLPLVIKPLALDASNPAALAPLKTVPTGRYAITLIQSTGQTWRVPNELSPGVGDQLGLPAIASQAGFVQKQ